MPGAAGCGRLQGVAMLGITVDSGEQGPVIRLSGEADMSTARELSGALDSQISGGARHLTVDLSQLRFADSATVRGLVEAYHMLKDQGRTLELAGPQPAVARMLSVLGVDRVLRVRPGSDPADDGRSWVPGVPRMPGLVSAREHDDGPLD